MAALLQQPLPGFNQRWRDGRASYRPAGEVIDTSKYEVAEIMTDEEARSYVVAMRYSKAYVAARLRFGLYRGGQLTGVAVFSHPCSNRVLTNTFPGTHPLETIELGRFVLDDSVEGNGETWMLARCFEVLRKKGIVGVVSFSDPVPRTTITGEVRHAGHVGCIYQSASARFLGRSTPRTLKLLPDARVLSDRSIQKIRKGERGWRYAARLLEEHGADPAPEEGRAEWLAYWCPRLTRPLRHPGNFRYAWAFNRTLRRRLAAPLPYPKKDAFIRSEDLGQHDLIDLPVGA